MKILALVRHAKSSWKDASLNDFDRPLNGRGRRSAFLIGRELRERGASFDYLLVSPAMRTRETLDNMAAGFGESLGEPKFSAQVYLAGARKLLEIARALPDEAASAMIIGHNTGLQEFVLNLSRPSTDGLREQVEVKFPTGAVATIRADVAKWSELEPGCGELIDLIFPRALD